MEKCFLLVFALFKESKQGQDKIILLLIVILFPPPPSVFFFEFLLVFQLSVVKPETKITNQRKGKYPMGPMRTQRKIKKTARGAGKRGQPSRD